MDKVIKARWIQALLSGDYEQGQHSLRDSEGKFCCLGVLCDLYSQEDDKEARWEKSDGQFNGKYRFKVVEEDYGHSGVLPLAVSEWAGLTSDNVDYDSGSPMVVMGDGYMKSLASMNDSGDSFGDIADHIEESL
jgi:hypothetical protein